jgi:hypothetical protein
MNYWETIFKDPKERAMTSLTTTVKNGRIMPVSEARGAYNKDHPDEPTFIVYEYPDTPVRVLTVCRTNPGDKTIEAVNGFPFLAIGEPNVFEVLALNADDIGSEGTVECVSKASEEFTFFDPLFCYNKALLSKTNGIWTGDADLKLV